MRLGLLPKKNPLNGMIDASEIWKAIQYPVLHVMTHYYLPFDGKKKVVYEKITEY